jgi:heptosyltransferase-1
MNIAIVKLSALGDIIHTSFVLQFIKQKIPDAKIDWIVEEGFASILEHNLDIDNIKIVNLKSIKKNITNILDEINRVKKYAKEEYDVVIDLQGLAKSAITSRLLSSNVAGFDKESIRESIACNLYKTKVHIPYHENIIDRTKLLVSSALDIEISKEEVMQKKRSLFFSDDDKKRVDGFLQQDKKNIIFIIGSTWQSRIYPKEKFLEVANSLEANILIPHGNKEEREFANFIELNSKNAKALPKLNLNELKALISKADLLIGNDTGPSYIAWANNIPSVLLYGPTPPNKIYTDTISKVLTSSSHVDPYKLNKEDYSIKEIEPKEIVKIANELLNV